MGRLGILTLTIVMTMASGTARAQNYAFPVDLEIYDLLISGVTGDQVSARLRTARDNLAHHRRQLAELEQDYQEVAKKIPLWTYNAHSSGAHVIGGRDRFSVDLDAQLDREYAHNRKLIDAWIRETTNAERIWSTLSELRTPTQIQEKRQSLERLLANDLAIRRAAGGTSSHCGERLARAASVTVR
jgi:hypothetical protein